MNDAPQHPQAPPATPADRPALHLMGNRRLLLFLATSLLVLAALWQARGALAPFVFGLAVAYLISPLVGRLHRAMPERLRGLGFSRLLAILVVYGALLAVVGGALLWLVPAVAGQANELIERAPELYGQAATELNTELQKHGRRLPDSLDVSASLGQLLDENASILQDLVPRLAAFMRDGAMAALGAISSTISLLLALVVVPIWLIYILNDTGRVLQGALGLIPRGLRSDVEALRIIFDRVLSAYIRGQLIIALILGSLLTIALSLLGVEYAVLLGFLNGVLGFIPFLGSIIGAVPVLAVALLGGPALAGKALVAILIIQQVDGALISPRVQGDSVKLHPALIMVVLVIGQQLMGLLGLLIAVPLTAILRDIVHFAYLRVGEDGPGPVEALATVGYDASESAVMMAGGGLPGKGGSQGEVTS
jgi:predicted PurR-regulated permease PerM